MRKYHQPDYQFIVLSGILIIIGLVVLTSASAVVGYHKFNDAYFFLKHQLLYGLLPGSVLFFVLSRINYHFYQKIAPFLFVFSLILLVSVFIPGLGYGRGVSKQWISLFGVSFQPSELIKFSFLIYLAAWFDNRRNKIKDWLKVFIPFIVLLTIVSVPILFQSDLGTLVIIFITAIALYFVAGIQWCQLALIIVGLIGLVFLMIKSVPYRLSRLIAFLNPKVDPQGIGYHIQQVLIAIGSGGIFGLGIGHSRQRFLYVPEVFSDSIFAVMAEEFGFIITVGVIILYIYLAYRGFKIARQAPDYFGKMLASGIIFYFIFQTLINIGAMVGLLPLTGVPLPLISYGGSAMTLFLGAFGILINISRQTI